MPNDPYAPPASKIDGDTSLAVASFSAMKMEIHYANSLSDLVLHNVFAIWRNPLFFVIYAGMILLSAYGDAYDNSGMFHVSRFLWAGCRQRSILRLCWESFRCCKMESQLWGDPGMH